MVVPLTPTEHAFLDLLLDQGRVEPRLLTADERLQDRIATEPWLRWKALNVRRHQTDRTRSTPPATSPAADTHHPAQPLGVHVRRYQPDNWGWEVATTSTPAVCCPAATPPSKKPKPPATS